MARQAAGSGREGWKTALRRILTSGFRCSVGCGRLARRDLLLQREHLRASLIALLLVRRSLRRSRDLGLLKLLNERVHGASDMGLNQLVVLALIDLILRRW